MTDACTAPSRPCRRPSRFAMPVMRAWHGAIAGGFLVAWLTGDSDEFYIMHQVAGYTVLAAVVLRLLVGVFASKPPWRMPRPSLAAAKTWLTTGRGRNPLFAWLAVALFAVVGGAALSGMLADSILWLEDLHEGLSEASLWVVLGHIAFILFIFGGRKVLRAAWSRLTAPRPRIVEERS